MPDFVHRKALGAVSTARRAHAAEAPVPYRIGALLAGAGNRAIASAVPHWQSGGPISVQREEDGDEDPFETVSELKDREETVSQLAELVKTGEIAEEEVGGLGSFFGVLGAGYGVKNVVEGISQGGEEGVQKAVSGGLGTIGGVASAVGAAPVAAAAGLGGLTYALGNAGVKEAPWIPKAAASAGEWADEHIGGITDSVFPNGFPGPEGFGAHAGEHHGHSAAGVLATLGGSVAMAPVAAAYGAKRAARSAFAEAPGLDEAEALLAARTAPKIDLKTPEHIDDLE